jgi:predicted signal transduction protein with EAL and GGDEF domain
MPAILNYIAALIVGLSIGHAVGNWNGRADGQLLAVADHNVIATDKGNKANSQREKIEHETRKLTDPAVDAELRAGGWMRE